MKTPIVPPEDLPYTLSMVATISSQHGIERVQSNCSLSPVKYLGNDKTTAQVVSERALLSAAPLFLRLDPVLPECSLLFPVTQKELRCEPALAH